MVSLGTKKNEFSHTPKNPEPISSISKLPANQLIKREYILPNLVSNFKLQ